MPVWLSTQEIQALPTGGPAYDADKKAAVKDWGSAKISNQDSKHDIYAMAGALHSVRGGDSALRDKVHAACKQAIGTEAGGRTLALGRNLAGYIIAADTTGYRDPAFVTWVGAVRHKSLEGDTMIATHERRPNNWGTMCGLARIAADVYIGDVSDLAKAVTVLRGWLGDRAMYAGFKFSGSTWQSDPTKP